ncbi:hypothetical protein ACCY16_21945, partial [Candidatus Pantoea formicae]|uniref:hypothetical protein n=1 Tax=Candidatus Pantoea formicae TaxID=2608355 RepID=UPI003EDA9DE4
MVNPLNVESFLGIGNYLLIGCDKDFIRHFLLSGYGVLSLGKEELSNSIQLTNYNYNFSVIMVDEFWSDKDYGCLLAVLSKTTGLNRVLFLSTVRDGEKKALIESNFIGKMNGLGYGFDSNERSLIGSEFISLIKNSEVKNVFRYDYQMMVNVEMISEIKKYIRPNENVCVIGECSELISNDLIRNCIIAKSDYYSDFEGFLKNKKNKKNPQEKEFYDRCEYYDCI